MPCTCCEPPDLGDVEGVFNSERATGEAGAYLRHGLEARAERLIAYLVENCAGPLRVLEIGSGAGGVHYELLRRGLAASAVGVEASAAYLDAARSVGERLNLSSRVQYVHGDFTVAADDIGAADAVILDRVICCYPHLNELLGASASKAERYLALSYPREKWPRLYGHTTIRRPTVGRTLTICPPEPDNRLGAPCIRAVQSVTQIEAP